MPVKTAAKKPAVKKTVIKKKPVLKAAEEEKKESRYFKATGRRKTSLARVRLWTKGDKIVTVNQKPLKEYFPSKDLQQIVLSPLEKMNCEDKFNVQIITRGGGIHSQAEAARHGISRGLVEFNPDFKKRLRKTGYLTRDPRMRERKKFGLKRARRAPQWRKR